MWRKAPKFGLTIAVALSGTYLTAYGLPAAEAPANTVNEELKQKIAENSPELLRPLGGAVQAADPGQASYERPDPLALGLKLSAGGHHLADPGQVSEHETAGSSWELFKSEVGRRRVSMGFGIFVGAKIGPWLTLQQELWVKGREDHRADFSGAGPDDTTAFYRSTLTAPAVATLGWPDFLGIRGLKPYALGGVYGERILNDAQKFRGWRGRHRTDLVWKEAPAEDWGWVYGGGVRYKFVGLEWLVEEGQKDLDPSGPQPLKTRSAWLVIVAGWQ